MAETKEKETEEDLALTEIHNEALSAFNVIQSAVYDERQQSLDDRRFYSIAGAQWEGDLQKYYENKPKIEVNKIHLSVIRIINEYRNNRITVDFTSKDGTQNDKLATMCDGLYRADEQDSDANEAYDNAFEEAVGGGIGAWRLIADYEDKYDDEDERQRISIEPIYDADSSVYFDLNAKRQDKRDAKYCYVLTSMTPEEYEETYDDSLDSWEKTVQSTEFDWSSPTVVYVAEYYKCEVVSHTVKIFKSITEDEEKRYTTEDLKEDPLLESELLAQGYKEVRQKKVKQKKIHKYILSGGKVLEDCGFIPGNEIPIVPMYGKRWFIDNVERTMGHVRLSRDAQILKNIQLSKLAEISSLSSVEKPIVTPEQIAGNEIYWEEDNVKNHPFLPINPTTDADGNSVPAGPLAYTRAPNIPPALVGLLQITDQDIKELLGDNQALEQVNMNLSGEAIGKLQDRLDMQTYIYVSNMVKAMKRSGEIWLSMAKDIYVEPERKMKIIDKQESADVVEISRPISDNGEVIYENDLSKAKFSVNVDVGPATSSKKQATIKNLITALQASADPEMQRLLSLLIMMNMEGEGVSDAAAYARKTLVRQGVIEPNEKEREQMAIEAQNQEPSAEEIFLESEAQKNNMEVVKKASDIEKNQMDMEKTNADIEKIKAETIETLSAIPSANQEQNLQNTQLAAENLETFIQALDKRN